MTEITLAIIKPDAVSKNKIGEIISIFEKNSLSVDKIKMKKISRDEAIDLYSEHINHKRFDELIQFMTSGKIVILILQGKDAIKKTRYISGSADPEKARNNSIRNLYGTNFLMNAMHSSDSLNSAEREVSIFFNYPAP